MNHRKRNWMQALLSGTLILLALTGCAGGGGSTTNSTPPTETVTIPGIATKGPIAKAKVSAYQVEADGKKGKQLGNTVITGDDGKYILKIPIQSGPVLIEVVGSADAKYISETTKLPIAFTETEVLRAITTNADSNVNITVSPLTEAAYQKVLQLAAQSPTSGIGMAIEKGNDAVAVMHKISNILGDPAVDTNYSAALVIADKIIQSGTATNTTALTDMISSAVITTEGRTTYSTAVASAASTLTSISGVSDVSGTVQTVLQSPASSDTTPPTVPAFTKFSSTAYSTTIEWSASVSSLSKDLRYYLYRNGTSIKVTPDLTYTDTNLQPATAYKYEIKSVDPNSNFSPLSTPLTVTTQTDTTPPTTPVNLQITAVSANSVSLSWVASTGNIAITSYEVYRDAVKLNTVTTNSYVDTSVVLGGRYTYTVRALNANGIYSVFSSSSVPITITSNPALITPITVTSSGSVQ